MAADAIIVASIETRFTRAYGLTHPFACAGLAFAGMTPPLAIAVTKAGGMGSVGIGKMPAPYVKALVEAIRAEVSGPVHVNFITIFTTDSHIAICEDIHPDVVSFHWGHPPTAWIRRLQTADIKVWEQVGSVAAAKLAVDDGIDLIISQGTEAGGHNHGTLPLFVLLPEVIDAVAPRMVLAAGGIADGRGIAGALALGADGVWVGTRMVATEEADIADGYKSRLTQARGDDAVLSSLFGRDTPDFNPMRVLRNAIVEEWQGREDQAPANPSAQELLGTMRIDDMELPLHRFSNLVPMRTATGDIDQMPILAGQGVGLIRAIEPAAVVIDRMMSDAKAILTKLGQSVS